MRRGAELGSGYNNETVDLTGGCEWVVEAHGCDPVALQDVALLSHLFEQVIDDLRLHPLTDPQWHRFEDGGGGVTGLTMLRESHIACHTFPEYRSLCLNLFCCRPKPEWDFESRLREQFQATSVRVRRIERPYYE